LNSNEVPLESDCNTVESMVSRIAARLVSLDDEISFHRDQLKQLEEERTIAATYRARNQAVLSPLRRTPHEVLGEIFSWTLPSIHEAAQEEGFNASDSPWVLTHVSSQWRVVALSTPSLWSLIV
ncbi:hypothetical protein DFH07DRAFT_700093, partial [Mycena maculata]